MFDIGWSEMLVVAVVAIIIVGPKDLPRMLRTVGKTVGQMRRAANDFRRQFDDALREAEKEADLDETREALSSIGKIDPLAEVRDEVKSIKKMAEKPLAGASDTKAPDKSPAADKPAAKTAAKAKSTTKKQTAKKPAAKKPAGKTTSAKSPAKTAKPRTAKKTAAKTGSAKPAAKRAAAKSKSVDQAVTGDAS
ncbi:MAG: Sec-independent protein translocase protein TatB [Alphaproteobacteria bacterium]